MKKVVNVELSKINPPGFNAYRSRRHALIRTIWVVAVHCYSSLNALRGRREGRGGLWGLARKLRKREGVKRERERERGTHGTYTHTHHPSLL